MAKASAAVVVGYAALGVFLAAGAALCCGIARADGGVGAYLNASDDNGRSVHQHDPLCAAG